MAEQRGLYEIVIADWAGEPSRSSDWMVLQPDTQVLEHVTPQGRCLVYATTLGIRLEDAVEAARTHTESCERAL